MHQDLIQEWFSHPATLQFFKLIKESTSELNQKSRFSLRDHKGNYRTAESVALECAHIQGQIESFEEILTIKEDGELNES